MDTLHLPGFDRLSTQIAQELYDPANRLASDPDLADSHEDFAAFILNLYGASLEPPGTLLPALICDAVESGLDTEETLITRVDQHTDVSEAVVPDVEKLVGGLVRQAEKQAAEILDRIGIERVPPGKQTLYACARIAQAAYDGKERKTGEEYYQHPKRAAAMALRIFSQLEAEGHVIEPGFKDAVICAAFLHDATEETMRSCKYYDPDRPRGFSPLLVREIFRQTGNPHGRIVARSLHLMTHYAKQRWAPEYETYVELGSEDFIFDLVKTLDMRDNLLHPKPMPDEMDAEAKRKIINKRAMYRKLIGTLALSTAQHTDNPHNKLWSPRYFDLLGHIRPDQIPAMVQDLNRYIFDDDEEPALQPGSRLRPDGPATKLFPAAA